MHGLYIGSMGMMSNQLKINTLANNISNANTNGYKFDTMLSEVFENKKAYRNEGERTFIGDYQNKVIEQGTNIDLKQGSFQLTSGELNMALKDSRSEETSFFVVSKGQDTFLTRNGEFHLNEDRAMKTYSGAYVQDVQGNNITIPEKMNYSIGKNGDIRDVETGDLIAQMQIRVITQETKPMLEKAPAGMFQLNNMDIAELPLSTASVETNMLETSNVDMTNEMVEMMNAQRRFQASQKVMVSFDKIYEKEANELLK